MSICRTLYIQRSVILLREHRLAKQKRAAFGFSLSGGNRLVVACACACACARSQLQYKILRTRGRPRDLIFNQFSIDCCQNAFASGAPPRTPLGGLQRPPNPQLQKVGSHLRPPILTFLDPPLIIDEKLTWKDHISLVRSKIAKTVGILYRVRHLLNRSALFILYCSLFLPYLTYCAEIWGNTYKSNIQCIFLLQKKIVRIVYGANCKDHTDVIFQDFLFFYFMI